jgi:hypothetical protein
LEASTKMWQTGNVAAAAAGAPAAAVKVLAGVILDICDNTCSNSEPGLF